MASPEGGGSELKSGNARKHHMADVFPSKVLPDYFRTVDFRSPEDRAQLIRCYEDEQVIVIKGRRVDFDREFWATVTMPNERPYKKFKAIQFISSIRAGRSLYPQIVDDCFGGDRGRFDYFCQQLASINAQIDEVLVAAAPTYQTEQRLTLRCAVTMNENLHFDVYDDEIATHHLRLFVNLDSAHRIWTTSWRLSDVLRDRLKELDRRHIEQEGAGQLMKRLNFHVFGGLDAMFEERGEPRHVAMFEPGEIWFVDSRKVSHQIFYGRRAISSESTVTTESMADPMKHYLRQVDVARRQILANTGQTTGDK